jgi:hypothetical protein
MTQTRAESEPCGDDRLRPVPSSRPAYRSPRLTALGHMAHVTRKSGVVSDQQQVRKPSSGIG